MSGSVTNVIRNLFLVLDLGVYWLVDQAYWLFSMLSEASVFTQSQIESFANRIYVLISIIMLFKLGFSFISYVVNPDSFTDKQKGGVALIKKIVITMALLVSVPTIFNEAYYLQKIIFQNNVIEKVLLGDSSVQSDNSNNNKSLSTYAFLTFFKPTDYIKECRNYEGLSISSECETKLNTADTTAGNPGTAYSEVLKTYNIQLIRQLEIVNAQGATATKGNDNFYRSETFYLFDYNYPISTVVGGFLAWIMIGFCLDLAVRSVKLSFLQIIAPIPIILSLSPQQKNNTLANWGKECVSTWASLFIRVLVVTFALSLIITINTDGGIFSFVTGGTNKFSIVTVFVMLGILLFAKEFPKLLEDILGIKGAGKMTFNAFKKLGSVPLVGGLATAGATALGGAGMIAGRAAWGTAKSLFKGTGSAIKGEKFGTGFKEGMGETGERIGARWHALGSSAKEKITSAGLKGTDKLGGNMHKAYQENFRSKDYKKTREEYKEGERLYQRTLTNGAVDDKKKYDIYSSKDFGAKVETMDKAKERRDTIAGEYEKMKMRYESGEEVQYREGNKTYNGAEAVNKARIASAKAAADYDKSKADFDKIKIQHKADAERYAAFSAAEDRHKVQSNVSSYVTTVEEIKRKAKEEGKENGTIVLPEFDQTGVSNTNRNQQLQDSITAAIREGFANMQGNGAPQPSNNQQTRPSGIVDSSGRPISSGNSQASGQVNRPINTNNSQPSNHNNQNIIDDDHRGF